MSSDPAINSALLALCARAHQGAPSNPPPTDAAQEPTVHPRSDTAATSEVTARSAADYVWLREALNAVESPERQVKQLLARMEETDVSEEDMLGVLTELAELVEDVNWATEFALMQGPARVVGFLRDCPAQRAAVRAGVAMVIAHSAQLNAPVQDDYARANALDVLLPCVAEATDARSLAALLHACSCLCRESDRNTVYFFQHNGMDVLTAVLQRAAADPRTAATSKVLARVLFLLSYFADKGVCTEELIERTAELVEARHTTADSGSASRSNGEDSPEEDTVEVAAAHALLALFHKSPTTVKRVVRDAMPRSVRAWAQLSLDTDPRARLARELDGVS